MLLVMLMLVVVVVEVALSGVDAGCRFPDSLQSNSSGGERRQRDWVGRVRDQFTELGVRVDIAGNVLRVTSVDSSSQPSYSAVCLQTVAADRYLVAYETAGQRSARYTCVQFTQHAVDVMQLRSAAVTSRMDRRMCQDSALRTDPWLIVDRAALGQQRVPCPLHGGFSVHLFDKARQTGVCDAYRGETRLECDCERGDGVVFLFRRTRCIPADMYMYRRQPTRCVAAWAQDSAAVAGSRRRQRQRYRFTILRHDDSQHNYFWLLRTPAAAAAAGSSGDFSAVLFKDLVADTLPQVNETRNYIRLAVQRDPATTPLCDDEYDVCSDSAMGVERRCRRAVAAGAGAAADELGLRLALTCPRTCGLCDDGSPSTCQLPPQWIGRWIDGASGTAVTVNASTIHIADGEGAGGDGAGLRCVRWRGVSESPSEAMLVTVYRGSESSAGCRPRYRCARLVRRSASLVYLQLSDASSWPLVRSPLDRVDCGAFQYDRWTASPPVLQSSAVTASSTSGFFLSLLGASSPGVDCGLPRDVGGAEFDATFFHDDETPWSTGDCTATLSDGGEQALRLSVTGCGDDVQRSFSQRVFSCAESSQVNGTDSLVIVTRSAAADGSSTLFCWFFVDSADRRLAGLSPSASFYLLTGDQCHAGVAVQSTSSFRPTRQLVYTAAFTRRRLLAVTSASTAAGRVTTRSPLGAANETPTRSTTSPAPARTDNSTAADSDLTESPRNTNVLVLGFVAILLAVFQAVLFCRC